MWNANGSVAPTARRAFDRTGREVAQRTSGRQDLGVEDSIGGDDSDAEAEGRESLRESAARMGHFGNFGRESQRFLGVFQHHTEQHPHKMRLRRYFSTEP
jgi:hypothetical protein